MRRQTSGSVAGARLSLSSAPNERAETGRPAWQATSAFKNGHVYEVNPDIYSRSTPRILDALAELIAILDETRP